MTKEVDEALMVVLDELAGFVSRDDVEWADEIRHKINLLRIALGIDHWAEARKGIGFHAISAEAMADGSGYVVVRRPGTWARSEEANEAVTLDFDADDNLISVEIIASPKETT